GRRRRSIQAERTGGRLRDLSFKLNWVILSFIERQRFA
ncbi:unnamed protein product, partial [Arabidopsis halleri]